MFLSSRQDYLQEIKTVKELEWNPARTESTEMLPPTSLGQVLAPDIYKEPQFSCSVTGRLISDNTSLSFPTESLIFNAASLKTLLHKFVFQCKADNVPCSFLAVCSLSPFPFGLSTSWNYYFAFMSLTRIFFLWGICFLSSNFKAFQATEEI